MPRLYRKAICFFSFYQYNCPEKRTNYVFECLLLTEVLCGVDEPRYDFCFSGRRKDAVDHQNAKAPGDQALYLVIRGLFAFKPFRRSAHGDQTKIVLMARFKSSGKRNGYFYGAELSKASCGVSSAWLGVGVAPVLRQERSVPRQIAYMMRDFVNPASICRRAEKR